MAKRTMKKSGQRSKINLEKKASLAKKAILKRKSRDSGLLASSSKSPKRATQPVPQSRSRQAAATIRAAATDLAKLSTEALAAELDRRRRALPLLEKRANELRAELSTVLAHIASLTGGASAAIARFSEKVRPADGATGSRAKSSAVKSAASRGDAKAPRRRGGKPTVAENIQSFLRDSGAVHPLREIVDGTARMAGREVNTSYGVQVSATMRKLVDAGTVRQVGRGQYQANGATASASGAGDNGSVSGG
jgi:hypothetical protein